MQKNRPYTRMNSSRVFREDTSKKQMTKYALLLANLAKATTRATLLTHYGICIMAQTYCRYIAQKTLECSVAFFKKPTL